MCGYFDCIDELEDYLLIVKINHIKIRKKCLHFIKTYDIINFVAETQRKVNATVVQLVVRHLAKVEVAGSSPVCRSS